VVGGIAIARVSYGEYLRFVWPLLAILAVLTVVVLAMGAYVPRDPRRERMATLTVWTRAPARPRARSATRAQSTETRQLTSGARRDPAAP
jgi:hypothetical protein